MNTEELENFVYNFEKVLKMDEYYGQYSSDEETDFDEEDQPEPWMNLKPETIPGTDIVPPTPSRNDIRPYPNPSGTYPAEGSGSNFVIDGDGDSGYGFPSIPGSSRRTPRNRSYPSNRRGSRSNINPEYIPSRDTRTYDDDYLNLDCITDKQREIEGWGKRMCLIVQSNTDTFTNVEYLENFLEYKMSGNVLRWWNNVYPGPFRDNVRAEAAAAAARSGNAPNTDAYAVTYATIYIQLLERLLVQEFVGTTKTTNQEAAKEAEKQKAKYILDNVRLCDICYFKEFTCEYEKWYHFLSPTEQKQYQEAYYRKLPPSWSIEMQAKWPNRPAHIADTFAGRAKFLQETIENMCTQTAFYRNIGPYNNAPCCDPALIDIPGQWGCSPARTPYRKNYRKKYRKYKKKYRRYRPKYRRYRRKRGLIPPNNFPRYRRRRRNYRNRRYDEREENPREDKKKNCPQGKKNCRCWVCQEEGHYANECPKKTKDKAKMLEAVFKLELEPIESDNEETSSEYEVEFDYEIREFSENPGSDWESVSESEDEWMR